MCNEFGYRALQKRKAQTNVYAEAAVFIAAVVVGAIVLGMVGEAINVFWDVLGMHGIAWF
ncbi:hypothetical protein CSIRO_3076 [Bradyrhizobiaceae bacterium SG-6C]|nr:hypothetical protein CSIRO_3076 [Bradyrhizobiaceae bacterium SG-6C]